MRGLAKSMRKKFWGITKAGESARLAVKEWPAAILPDRAGCVFVM